MTSPNHQTVHLTATYTSPNTDHQPQILSQTPLTLPTPLSQDESTTTTTPTQTAIEAKTTYLRTLRAATISLQEKINADLTARMAEDNARDTALQQEGSQGETGTKKKAKTQQQKKRNGGVVVNEDAEEENYGEEVVDEDDDA